MLKTKKTLDMKREECTEIHAKLNEEDIDSQACMVYDTFHCQSPLDFYRFSCKDLSTD